METDTHKQSRRDEYRDILQMWERRFGANYVSSEHEKVLSNFNKKGWDAVFIDIYGLSDYKEVLEIDRWGERKKRKAEPTQAAPPQPNVTASEVDAALEQVAPPGRAQASVPLQRREAAANAAGAAPQTQVSSVAGTGGASVASVHDGFDFSAAAHFGPLLGLMFAGIAPFIGFAGVLGAASIGYLDLGGAPALWVALLAAVPLATALGARLVPRRRGRAGRNTSHEEEDSDTPRREERDARPWASPWRSLLFQYSIFVACYFTLNGIFALNHIGNRTFGFQLVVMGLSLPPALGVSWRALGNLWRYEGAVDVWIALVVWIPLTGLACGPFLWTSFKPLEPMQLVLHPYGNKSLSTYWMTYHDRGGRECYTTAMERMPPGLVIGVSCHGATSFDLALVSPRGQKLYRYDVKARLARKTGLTYVCLEGYGAADTRKPLRADAPAAKAYRAVLNGQLQLDDPAPRGEAPRKPTSLSEAPDAGSRCFAVGTRGTNSASPE